MNHMSENQPAIDVPVLVIGAGPTGLMMASELARQGVRCRIIDKAPQASQLSKALAIHARTLEIFENIGIADQFVSAGVEAHGGSLCIDRQSDLGEVRPERDELPGVVRKFISQGSRMGLRCDSRR